jgi:hypothetical protein
VGGDARVLWKLAVIGLLFLIASEAESVSHSGPSGTPTAVVDNETVPSSKRCACFSSCAIGTGTGADRDIHRDPVGIHRDGGTLPTQPGLVPVGRMVSRLLALQLALHGAISGRFRHHSPDGATHLTW